MNHDGTIGAVQWNGNFVPTRLYGLTLERDLPPGYLSIYRTSHHRVRVGSALYEHQILQVHHHPNFTIIHIVSRLHTTCVVRLRM